MKEVAYIGVVDDILSIEEIKQLRVKDLEDYKLVRDRYYYCGDTDTLRWNIKVYIYNVGDEVGGITTNGGISYMRTKLKGKHEYLHRLVWLYTYGYWPTEDIDHLDGDGTNNAISNLRHVSRAINLKNKRRGKTLIATSGYRGVECVADKHRAWKKEGGVKTHLGMFDTPEEAYEVRMDWEKNKDFTDRHMMPVDQ